MADLLRVRINLTGMITGPGLSTFYFLGTSQTDADLAADAAFDFYVAIRGQIPSYGTMTVDSEVDVLSSVTGSLLGSYGVSAQTTTGTNATDAMGGAVNGLLRLGTGVVVAGRQLKGHLFIPGPCEGGNDAGGHPTAGYATTVKGAADVLVLAAGTDWVIWSKTHGVAHSVTTTSVWNQWAILRGRRD